MSESKAQNHVFLKVGSVDAPAVQAPKFFQSLEDSYVRVQAPKSSASKGLKR